MKKKAAILLDGPSDHQYDKCYKYSCSTCKFSLNGLRALNQHKTICSKNSCRIQRGPVSKSNDKPKKIVLDEESMEVEDENKEPFKSASQNIKARNAKTELEVEPGQSSEGTPCQLSKKESEINISVTKPCHEKGEEQDWVPLAHKKNSINKPLKRTIKKQKKTNNRSRKLLAEEQCESHLKNPTDVHSLINELYFNMHSSLYSIIKPYLLEKVIKVTQCPIRSLDMKQQVILFNLLLFCEEIFVSKYNLNKFNLNHLVEFLNFFSINYLPQALRFDPMNRLLVEEKALQIFKDNKHLQKLDNWVKWYQANNNTSSIAVFFRSTVMGEVAQNSISYYSA